MAAASTRNLGPTTTTFAWRLGGKARRAENNAGDRGTMVNAKACCGCRGHNGADAQQSSSNNSATSDRRAKSVLAGNAVRRIVVVVVVCMGDGILLNGIILMMLQ